MVHLSREVMEAFCAGKLTLEEEGQVVSHLLLEGCRDCLAAGPPQLSTAMMEGLPSGPLFTEEQEKAYEVPIKRALEAFLQERRRFQKLQPQIEQALQALRVGGDRPKDIEDLAYMRALIARSWELRFDSPKEMVHLAWTATQVSLGLDPARCGGPKRVFDHQAEAMASLGNAQRVANQYREAQDSFVTARLLFEKGTHADHLEARLLDLEASLLGDLHKFVQATAKLKQVHEFHTRNGDRHLAGRVLVKLGLYAAYAGNFKLAIQRTQEGLQSIDQKREPELAFIAAKNLILFHVENGCIGEAKKLRLFYSSQLASHGGHIGETKLRDIDGRIAAGLGRYQRAEAIFREVREGFAEVGLPVLAGIASLDLGSVLLRQGKTGEATGVILEAAAIFFAHQIRQDALEAIVLLRDAFRKNLGTLAMVEEVAAFLRRIDCDPTLRFDARAWEEQPDGSSTD